MPTRLFQADNVLPRTFWRYFKYAFLTDCWLMTIEFFSVVCIYTLFVMSNHVFFFNIAMMKIRLGTAFWVWNTTRASDAYIFLFRPRRNRKMSRNDVTVDHQCSIWFLIILSFTCCSSALFNSFAKPRQISNQRAHTFSLASSVF